MAKAKRPKPVVFRFSTRPKKTGIVLESQFFRFLKSTLQSELRDKLHVEILSNQLKDGHRQVYLVGTKGRSNFGTKWKPNFKEAKALIQSAVEMTEKNWKDIQEKTASPNKMVDTSIVILDDSSNIEDNSSADTPSKRLLVPPGIELVCESKPSNGLCTVVLDTQGGAVRSNSPVTTPLYNKGMPILEANIISNSESTSEACNVNSTSNLDCQKKPIVTGSKTESEDFIFIKTRGPVAKKKDPADETIVIGDDTILISSEDESEEDIKIERVVTKSVSPKKVKRKKTARSLSAGSLSVLPAIQSIKSKRKQNSPSPLQRSSKISKKFAHSDVSSRSLGVIPLAVNPCHQTLKEKPHNTNNPSASNNTVLAPKNQAKTLSGPSTSSVKYAFDNNIIALDSQPTKKTGLRPIVIDARNVGTVNRVFEFSKLEICIKYFRDRNHKVIAILPRHVQSWILGPDREKMCRLEQEQIISFTPSRKIPGGRSYSSYEDRFIVQVAHELGGVIVSNDNFRDIMAENEKWKETIENRLLMFTWIGNMLMFPNDPLGRDGPHLEEFLRFPKDEE